MFYLHSFNMEVVIIIYIPTNVYPNGHAVDTSVNNNFSLTFNGDKLSAYQFYILDELGSQVYASNKVALSSSSVYNGDTFEFSIPSGCVDNGNNYLWNCVLWEENPTMFIGSGVVQEGSNNSAVVIRQHSNLKPQMFLSIRDELRKITQIDTNEETQLCTVSLDVSFSFTPTNTDTYRLLSDFIQTPNYLFKARSSPVVSITNLPDSLDYKSYTFQGAFSQNEGVTIKYYSWNLYDSDGQLIDTTGLIYRSDLVYSFDGFMPNQSYSIELIVETQDGVSISTGQQDFSVTSSSMDFSIAPVVECLTQENALKVSWVRDRQAIGVATGDYEFINDLPFIDTNSVHIKSGEIYYDNESGAALNISEDSFTIFLSVNLEEDKEGNLLSLDGDRNYSLCYSGYKFVWVMGMPSNKIVYKRFLVEKFPLQSNSTPEADCGYIWDDSSVSQTWNDSYYWVESVRNLSTKQFKITLTPTNMTVIEVQGE